MKLSRKRRVILTAIALLLFAVTAIFLHRMLAVGFDGYCSQTDLPMEVIETEIPVQTKYLQPENVYDFEQNGLEPLVEELQKRNPQFNLKDYKVSWSGVDNSTEILTLTYQTKYFITDEAYHITIQNDETVTQIREHIGKHSIAAAPEPERNWRIFLLNCKIYLFELLYDTKRMVQSAVKNASVNDLRVATTGYFYIYSSESNQLTFQCDLLLCDRSAPDHEYQSIQKYC